MSDYNKQYQVEENLFGSPYKEFDEFLKTHAVKGGTALDLGCGQGRDALLLAHHGYRVTGVDSSKVGVAQMLERAKAKDLAVAGVVADFHKYEFDQNFDAIVLDSILHFEKADWEKELALLRNVSLHLNDKGYLFIFVHKSNKKEKELKAWYEGIKPGFELIQEGYIDYVYEEKAKGFRSEFQFYMLILQRGNPSNIAPL